MKYFFLARMTANQRQSKMSFDKTDFTWSLLAGWDYAIGNREAAQNKVIKSAKSHIGCQRDWRLSA